MRARADLRRPFSVVVAEVSASAARVAAGGGFGFGGFRAAAAAGALPPALLGLLLLDGEEAFLEPPPPLALEKEKPRAVMFVVDFFPGKEGRRNCEVEVQQGLF